MRIVSAGGRPNGTSARRDERGPVKRDEPIRKNNRPADLRPVQERMRTDRHITQAKPQGRQARLSQERTEPRRPQRQSENASSYSSCYSSYSSRKVTSKNSEDSYSSYDSCGEDSDGRHYRRRHHRSHRHSHGLGAGHFERLYYKVPRRPRYAKNSQRL